MSVTPLLSSLSAQSFDAIDERLREIDPASESLTLDGPLERSPRACLACRQRKIRCLKASTDARPSDVCARCRRLGLDCVRQARAKRGTAVKRRQPDLAELAGTERRPSPRNRSVASVSAIVQSSSRPTTRIIPGPSTPPATGRHSPVIHGLQAVLNRQLELRELVRRYFGTVHYYGYLTFIHEPSYLRMLDRGNAPRSLTAMIIACTLRFTGDQSQACLAKADAVYDEAFQLLLPQMYQRYGVVDLMTTLLARIFEHARGRFSASWMLVGNAVRMMQYLSLHNFHESYPQTSSARLSPLLGREAIRRLVWAVFYVDCMVDAGLHGVHTVHEDGIHVQLPGDDLAFMRGGTTPEAERYNPHTHPLNSISPSTPEMVSLSSHLIRTMAMRRRILHFQSTAKYSGLLPATLLERLDSMHDELRTLVASLPANMIYTEDNLFVHAQRRTAFVLLHVLRHNCFLMLLEVKLNLYKLEATAGTVDIENRQRSRVQNCLKQRLKHAIPTAQIIQDALRLDVNCDPYVASLGYTALEVFAEWAVIVLDPIRLRQVDASGVDAKMPILVEALCTVLSLLRRVAPVEEGIRNLRVEACRRLSKYGFDDLLDKSDREAIQSLIPNIQAQDDDEYDFRSFYWHRYEPRLQAPTPGIQHSADGPSVRTQVTAEGMLDPSVVSRIASRAASPIRDSSDAANVDASNEETHRAYLNLDDVGAFDPATTIDATTGLSTRPPFEQDLLSCVNTVIEPWEDMPWYDIEFNEAPIRDGLAVQRNEQWAALDYNSWSSGPGLAENGRRENISGLVFTGSEDADIADMALWLT